MPESGARIELHSSLLKAAVYRDRSAVLELEFRSGEIYHYYGVSARIYRELWSAQSPGGYFNQSIRGGFVYAKIESGQSGTTGDSGLPSGAL